MIEKTCEALFLVDCDECSEPVVFNCMLEYEHTGDHQFSTEGQYEGYPFKITWTKDMSDFLEIEEGFKDEDEIKPDLPA